MQQLTSQTLHFFQLKSASWLPLQNAIHLSLALRMQHQLRIHDQASTGRNGNRLCA